MPSYSVNLNAVVAQAATAVTRLQVVCAYGGSDTQVCVATAANLALAGGKLRGVALENQAAGFPIQIIDYGSVNATLAGSGPYVNYDASGNLTRSSTPGSSTVGTYENGVIHVNLDFPSTGSNATSLGGVPVSSAVATRSYVLAGDGSTARFRAGVLNVLDFLPTGTDPSAVTDWIAYLDAMVLAATHGQTLYLPKVAGAAKHYPISRTWRIFTDDEHGGSRHLSVVMENGRGLGTVDNCITAQFSDLTGTAASIDFVGSGTGAFRMMRLTGCTGVLLANASELVGCQVHVWGSATAANTCNGTLCKVEADGTIWVNNPSASSAIDAGGTVHWRIQRCAVEWGVYAGSVHGMAVVVDSGQDIWTLWHDTQPNGGNAAVSANRWVQNMHLSNNGGTGKYREAIAFAKNILPLSTNANYSTGVYSGVTVPQPYLPSSNSESSYDLVHAEFAPRGVAIAGYSGNGQSEQHHFTRLSTNFVQCVWDTVHTFNSSSAYNQAHANFSDVRVGTCYDTIFDSANAARPLNVDLVTGESGAGCRILRYKGSAILPSRLSRVYMSYYGTGTVKEHPTGELLTLTNKGPIQCSDVYCAFLNDSATWTVYCNSNTHVSLDRFGVCGTTLRAGRPAQKNAGNRGPVFFTDGDKFRLIANGVDQTVAITQAAVAAACTARFGSYTANREELTWMEFAAWVEANFTGVRCWGKWDSSEMTLLSTTGNLDVQAPAAGTDLNAKLGFATGAVAPVAQTQLSKDTQGLMELGAGVTDFSCDFVPVCHTYGGGTSVQYTVPSFRNRHYGTTYKTKGNVYPMLGTVTRAAGGTTFTLTFGSMAIPWCDEPDTNYQVRAVVQSVSAAVALGALQLTTITKSTNKIDFACAADPATGTVTWLVEVFR